MIREETSTLITNVEAERYDIVRQIDKHCQIVDKLQGLGQEISDLKSRARSTIEDVGLFLSRKERFRDEVYAEKTEVFCCNADKEVDKDVNIQYSKRSILSKDCMMCSMCGESFQRFVYDDHVSICSLANKASHCKKDNIVTVPFVPMNTAVRPTPPRNLQVASVNYSSIQIIWETSILDGGAPIIDYEVIYSIQSSSTVMRVAKRVSLLCSIYCLARPIPDNSFVIDSLAATTKYYDIKLRCKNKVGWSDFCQKIESVTTADPIRPAQPRWFSAKKITATSIQFQWAAPFHNGGGTLHGYVLNYLEPIVEVGDEQTTGRRGKILRLEERRVEIPSAKTQFDLHQLKVDTSYSDIQIVAVGNFGLLSEPAHCEDVQTNRPGRLYIIEKEIDRTMACCQEFIDTDFFQSGVLQRVNKVEYLTELEKERGRERLDSHEKDQDIKNNDEIVNEELILKPACRREQNFVYRMGALQREILDHRHSIEANLRIRANLTRQLSIEQEKIISLRSELKKISAVTCEFVKSSVLHGSEQKFRRIEFCAAIRCEVTESVNVIETCKLRIRLKDAESKDLSRSVGTKVERLHERQTAFLIFKKQKSSSSKIRLKTSTEPFDVKKSTFRTWIQFADKSRKNRKACSRILKCRLCSLQRHMILKWKNFAKYQTRLHDLRKGENVVVSRGGSMLVRTEIARINAHDEVKNAMKLIFSKSVIYESEDKALDDRLVGSMQEVFSIFKGDCHYHLFEYDLALSCYKGAFEELSMTKICLADKLQIECALLRRCGKSAIAIRAVNQAILYFERLLLISNESNFKIFEAVANLGLGQCYLHIGDTMLAKDHFVSSISQLELVDNSKLQHESSEGLQACVCYNNRQPYDMVKSSGANGGSESHMSQEIKDAKVQAETLQAQIRNITVHIGYTVPFKRVSCTCIKVRQRKDMLISNVTAVKEERRLNLEEVERLPNFITKIQNELSGLQNEKQGGDKRQRRVSSLVHDNIQSFDKTELMQRLQLRLKESQKSLIDALMKDKLLDVQIRNDTDELVDLNEELQLEEGDLLQRSLMRESIRLIVFNTLGHNDESDMKSDTHSLLIALSIGKNVFVYDSVTGTSVTVFEGDTSSSFVGSNRINGHTAIVTAISFHGKFIYSGAKDNTIRCWNIVTKQLEYVAEGHDATITSVCCTTTMLISGSADKSVMLWDKCNGEKLRNLNGHSRGVLALCEGNSVIVSGDADGEICLWDANKFTVLQRLEVNPKHRVTVVRSGNLEIVCGDAGGNVTIFSLQTGKILQQCKAHKTTVIFLEFDATKIVSSGMDCCVKVIDIVSCEILHSLRDFKAPVLALRFDTSRISTLSKDGIKHWMWDSDSKQPSEAGDGFKFHTVAKGETMRSICKIYDTSISNIIKWNDAKGLECGQKLIVGKDAAVGFRKDGEIKKNQADVHKVSRQMRGSEYACGEMQEYASMLGTNTSETKPEVVPDIKCEPSSLAARFTTNFNALS